MHIRVETAPAQWKIHVDVEVEIVDRHLIVKKNGNVVAAHAPLAWLRFYEYKFPEKK